MPAMNSVAAASSPIPGLAAATSCREPSVRPPFASRESIGPMPKGSTGRRRKPSLSIARKVSRKAERAAADDKHTTR